MSTEKIKTGDHKGVFSLFGYAPHPRSGAFACSIGLISGLLLVACGGDQPREEPDSGYYTDQSSAVFAPDPAADTGTQPSPDDDRPLWELGDGSKQNSDSAAKREPIGGWSIVLTKVTNGDMTRAQKLLRVIQDEAGLREAFIEPRDDAIVIAYGNYLGRDEAEDDLKRIRETQMMGTKPFESAIVRPPSSEELRGSNPAYDLRTVKQRYGKQAVYTLQIGVYGRSDYQTPAPDELEAYRNAAEEAVRDLRAQGVTAFYYHAPARSMVTVGVFGEKDFDSTTYPAYQSPRLKAMRERFPNNLLNGQGINETVPTESGKQTRLQSSQLVAIPEK